MTKPKQEPEKNILKRPAEAKDAKEVAKKLIKTGAIRAIKSSIEKEKIKEEKINSGFKRSQVHNLVTFILCLLIDYYKNK